MRTEMDKVYEELDEAKTEIEKLKAELRAKNNSLENLKRSLNAQVNQTQEAKLKAEKLDQELLQKADEIAETKDLYEDLKGKLKEQESIIKHLSAANDKLRVGCDEKLKKLENENRGLLMALEEANDKVENHEQQVFQYRQEIENLKGCLSVSKQKCLETKKNSKASNELRERDDMFYKLEEEKRKVEDQLKWKKEQFKHLEEAYEKLKDRFRSSEKEWEMEKSTLLDEISSQQIKLDSQIRVSEDLRYQLQNCHQALAHVESQKKRLEVEVSDFKAQLDNSSSEYHDARLQLDCVNSDRDKDIADLRYSLRTKEGYIKESKYIIERLEQENREFKMSLKELQEAHIQEAGASYSQSKLRARLRNLEQTHKDCPSTLKAKEAEWNSKIEQLAGDLNSCRSELEAKTAAVEELQMELESSHSLTIEMRLLNEEMSVMLLVLKQGISDAQLKLVNHKDEMDVINKEKEGEIFQLVKQLEMKDAALINAQKGINEECEKAACLIREVESYGSKKELQHSLQNELDRHKEMLEELTKCQMILKEKVMQMECELKEQLQQVHEALDCIISELDERICERNEMEFELQIWKSIVERLKNDLEENHLMRKELETSLLAQVDVGECLKQEKDILVYKLEEKEKRLDFLHQRVVQLEHELRTKETLASVPPRVESAVSSESDNVGYLHVIEEKDKALEELKKEVAFLEQESFRREFESAVIAKGTMERTCECEKDNLMEAKLRSSETLVQKLKLENRNLLENATRLSSERENLLACVQGVSDKINEFSTADTQLMDMLRRSMEQSFEIDCPGMNLKKDDDSFLVKENMLIQVSPMGIKKLEATSDLRSPFKELNS